MRKRTGNPCGLRLSDNTVLAQELGITPRRVRELGGAEKLRALGSHALAVLVGNHRYGNSLKMKAGGLKRLGMKHGRDEFLITPHIRMLAGFEELILDDVVAAVSVEGLA